MVMRIMATNVEPHKTKIKIFQTWEFCSNESNCCKPVRIPPPRGL